MATQEQFNELQQLLQQQAKQVEELTARLDAQNVAGRNLESQLGEEQRQRAAATEELARATSSPAEANRNLREERESSRSCEPGRTEAAAEAGPRYS